MLSSCTSDPSLQESAGRAPESMVAVGVLFAETKEEAEYLHASAKAATEKNPAGKQRTNRFAGRGAT